MYSRWNNGMVEYWNVGLKKEVTHFNASLSRGILPIPHPVNLSSFSLFRTSSQSEGGQVHPLTHFPRTHYSIIPVFQLWAKRAKFITLSRGSFLALTWKRATEVSGFWYWQVMERSQGLKGHKLTKGWDATWSPPARPLNPGTWPPSWLMKPYSFFSPNHLTVPFAHLTWSTIVQSFVKGQGKREPIMCMLLCWEFGRAPQLIPSLSWVADHYAQS